MKDIYELDDMSKLRSEFAANVSHELKTPLTSIKGFADMLASGVVTDEADKQRFITMISVEADRMINLINDILKLSELQEEVQPAEIEKTDALAAAYETAEKLHDAAEKAKVTITVSGDECSLPIDRERLGILLDNLAENAVKYNKPGGKVDIYVSKEGYITVSDTGIGIAPEHQNRVFERFYRVDKSRSKKTGGTGLGLAIVKHIMALYGGRIKLSSEPDKGTAITVSFDMGD